MTSPVIAIIYSFAVSSFSYQKQCQLGDGEKTRQWLWFTKTHFIPNYKLVILFAEPLDPFLFTNTITKLQNSDTWSVSFIQFEQYELSKQFFFSKIQLTNSLHGRHFDQPQPLLVLFLMTKRVIYLIKTDPHSNRGGYLHWSNGWYSRDWQSQLPL